MIISRTIERIGLLAFALIGAVVATPAMTAPEVGASAFRQHGAGAVVRTVDQKLAETVSITDFGAQMTADVDQSVHVNAAILAVYGAGGGIVTIPPGAIKASNIRVKQGVRLVGSGDIATTIVITDALNSAVTMEAYSGIESMRFYYPDQVTAGVPKPYPATITGGPSYAVLRNLKFQGAFDGVVFGNARAGVGSVLMENLTGFPLRYGIKLDNNTDTARINNVHFNPNVYGAYDDSLLAWVYQHGAALVLLRSDGPQVDSFLAYGYGEGIRLDQGTPTGSANMAKFNNIQLDVCRRPLNVGNHQDGVFFSNSVFTTGGLNYHGVAGDANRLGGGQTAASGVLSFYNSSFRHYISEIAVISSSTVFNNVQFDDYNLAAGAHSALRTDFPGVVLTLLGSSIDGRGRTGSGGISNSEFPVSVKVLGSTFSGIRSYDGLLRNARLALHANTYSAGFSWNGVEGIFEAGGEMATSRNPVSFGAIGPFLQGDRFSNIIKTVGDPKAWVRVSGSMEKWVSEGNL